MISFGNWPSAIHSNYEQVQRILSSKDKKTGCEIISMDKEAGIMKFQGSGTEPYVTSLQECTCSDFVHRHKPCKHIYRLAFEMGLLNDLPEYKHSEYDVDGEIDKYRVMYEDGKLPAEVYVSICKALSKIK